MCFCASVELLVAEEEEEGDGEVPVGASNTG